MKKILLLLLVMLTLSGGAKAQWVVSPGSSGGSSNIFRINAINTNVVWAIDENKQVYRTVNGGSTWNRFYLGNKFPGKTITSFTGFDANTAWAAVQNTSTWPWVAELHKTSDGGNTWVHQSSAYTNTDMLLPTIIHFFDANNGVIISDAYDAYFAIYTTSNGGTNWVKVPVANLPAPSPGNDFTLSINKYTAIGNTLWFAAGDMRIFKSTDKGLTWTAANTGIAVTPYNALVNNIAFTDANNGIINSVDIFRKTTDGGLTWIPFTPTGPFHTANISNIPELPGGYVSIQSAYTSTASAIGSSVSYDYGVTWQDIDVSQYHSAIAFSNPASGWAGDFGFLRKYTGSLLGTNEGSLAERGIIIYPNPSTGTFQIQAASTQPFSVEIYDLVGNKVLQQKGNSFGKNMLDLSGKKKGIYLLHILSSDKRIIEKIVLQ